MWLYNFILSIGESFYYSVIYDNRYKFILEGLFHTVLIAALAVIIGVVIGVVIALIRNYYEMSGKLKVLNKLSTWYVDIIRGTPVVLQLMIIYYVIFKSVDISTVVVGVLAFCINSGAYVSEIIRSGIQSVPIGQSEAGYSLGLEYYQNI